MKLKTENETNDYNIVNSIVFYKMFENENMELCKRICIKLEHKRNIKKRFNDRRRNIYLWYNINRKPHEKSLGHTNWFEYGIYEVQFDKWGDRFEDRVKRSKSFQCKWEYRRQTW